MNFSTVSVPGKIFLMGEHSVVYGKPAILSAINRRVYVRVAKTDDGKHEIESGDNQFIGNVLELTALHLKIKTLPYLKVIITSQLKKGYHLGSSAAVAAATIAAVLYHLKKIWNPELVNQLAYSAEKAKHGLPSGADNTACVFGGLIWYRNELSYLKSIWQLSLKSELLNNFYLVDSGKGEESTKDMVAMVKKRYLDNKQLYQRLFISNEEAVRNIAESLKNGNENALIQAIRKGSFTLKKMGVVSPMAADLIDTFESSGGAAKILGGGGRKKSVGYLLIYHKDKKILKDISASCGFSIEAVRLGEEGMRLEKGTGDTNQ